MDRGDPVEDSLRDPYPLSPARGTAPGPAVWISDDDIIGIVPSWDQPEPGHG